MSTLLLNREWVVKGSWYAPKEFLHYNFKSTHKIEHLNTTSSAGDWDGYFTQKIGGYYFGIRFYQYNNWPSSEGFTLTTGDSYVKRKTLEEIQDYFYDSQY